MPRRLLGAGARATRLAVGLSRSRPRPAQLDRKTECDHETPAGTGRRAARALGRGRLSRRRGKGRIGAPPEISARPGSTTSDGRLRSTTCAASRADRVLGYFACRGVASPESAAGVRRLGLVVLALWTKSRRSATVDQMGDVRVAAGRAPPALQGQGPRARAGRRAALAWVGDPRAFFGHGQGCAQGCQSLASALALNLSTPPSAIVGRGQVDGAASSARR